MSKYLYLFIFLIFTSCNNTASVKQKSGEVASAHKATVSEEKAHIHAPGLVFGKYGCTASKYSGGFIEYIPRGSFILSEDGQYTYSGFEKPSSGTFTVDAAGNLLFKGGYFDGGKAEKIDRPNKFFLVFPTNPDHRWTCSLVDDK
jgi:hypothetical protein